MSPARRSSTALAIAFAAGLCIAGTPATGRAAPPSPSGHRGVRELFVPAVSADFSRLRPSGRDALFLAGSVGVGALVAANDLSLERRVVANDSQAKHDLARLVQPLGNEVVVFGGVAAWGVAWLAASQPVFVQVQRADLSIAAASVCTLVLKECVGRKRPEESPNDAAAFDPFSGHDSFPSGHATMAFAAATALDRETRSRWVPAIAYPLAAFVGWSRLHDRKHWPSDIVAGAAIGVGVAWKAEDVMQPRDTGRTGMRLGFETGDGALAALRLRW